MEDDSTTSTTTHGRTHRRPRFRPLSKSTTHGDVMFHLLCTYSTSGAVIGTSGSIVKHLQQETGAKIRVEDYRSRSDERIITVIGPQSANRTIILNTKTEQVSPAQHGLIRVLERVWEVEAEENDKLSPGVEKKVVTCRLLAHKSQIGYLMGRGGERIKKLESDYKARIRALTNVPSCAPHNHEVIQIVGVSLAVKRATLAISQCLQDVPPLDKTQMLGSKTFKLSPDRPFSDSFTKSLPQEPFLPQRVNNSVDCASKSYPVPGKEEVVFRLLCSNDRIGGVIGKSANIVKALEEETRASIRAAAPVAESDDRVVHISARENPESQYSPAQNAVICVFKRYIEVGNGKKLVSGASKELVVEARLLVSSDQIGCLIGVGGTIISDIRKITHTSMWILRGDEVPPCAAEKDAVVKIEGSPENVQHALFIVTGKLRNTIFCNNMVNTAGRIEEPITAGSYPSLDCSHKPGQQFTLTEDMHCLGLSHNTHRSTLPESGRSQTMHGENSKGFVDIGHGAANPRGGLEYGNGRKSAVVMNTTLEILVPEYILGPAYGEKESNLSRLRQISGAEVILRGTFPGSSEATLVISGTPDQTQIAQSVLQALILQSENS